ncbi:MAG: hypothetical protein HY323_04980 [Betaproteobacteria bacterium]|nr:hypothetical protein [Betaproteobacteria bacterium]
MAYSLDDFCRDAREILRTDASRSSIDKVRACFEGLLADEGFVKRCFDGRADTGLRRIYVDPEQGFEVLAYKYDKARASQPHDHGDSWAIYGQVREYTDMTEWERTDDGSDPDRATLKVKRKYRLNPGQAGIYFGRDLHSTSHPAHAWYVRVTGTDLETVERLRIDAKTGRIERVHGRQVSAA